MDELVKFLNEDVLIGIESLFRKVLGYKANTEAENHTRLSLKIIVLLAIVLAVSRMFYGPAQTDLLQHFFAIFAVLLATYLSVGGLLLLIFPSQHISIRKYAAIIYLCLFAAGIFYFSTVVIFGVFTGKLGSFTTPLMNLADEYLPDSWNDWHVLITAEKWFPAVLFALIGSWIVLRSAKSEQKIKWYGKLVTFVGTATIFYFSVCDRDGFFDNVALLLSKLKLWA